MTRKCSNDGWEYIEALMASFSILEKDTAECVKKNAMIADTQLSFLDEIQMSQYRNRLLEAGYDSDKFLNGCLDDECLQELGLDSESDRKLILEYISDNLPNIVCRVRENCCLGDSKQFLGAIDLLCYQSAFVRHNYNSAERLRAMSMADLVDVLHIDKVGHRKRIMMALLTADRDVTDNLDQPICSKETRESGSKLSESTDCIQNGQSEDGKERSRDKINGLETEYYKEYLIEYLGNTQVRYPYEVLTSRAVAEITRHTNGDLEQTNTSRDTDITLQAGCDKIQITKNSTHEVLHSHNIVDISCIQQISDVRNHIAYVHTSQPRGGRRASRRRAGDGHARHPCSSSPTAAVHTCHIFRASSTKLAIEICYALGRIFEWKYQTQKKE